MVIGSMLSTVGYEIVSVYHHEVVIQAAERFPFTIRTPWKYLVHCIDWPINSLCQLFSLKLTSHAEPQTAHWPY